MNKGEDVGVCVRCSRVGLLLLMDTMDNNDDDGLRDEKKEKESESD